MSIKQMLIVTYVLLLVAAGGIVLNVFREFRAIDSDLERLTAVSFEVNWTLEELRFAGLRVVSSTSEVLLLELLGAHAGDDVLRTGEEQELLTEGVAALRERVKRYRQLVGDGGGHTRDVDRLAQIAGDLIVFAEAYVRDFRSLDTRARIDRKEQFEAVEQAFLGTVQAAVDTERSLYDQELADVQSRLDTIVGFMQFSAIVATLIAVALGLIVSGLVNRRFGALADVARAVAAGDYGARAEVPRRSELAEFVETFNTMIGEIERNQADRLAAEEKLNRLNTGLRNEVINKNDLIQETLEQLMSASQAKTRFLTSMSHELRTPLNAVMGYAQLLDAGTVGDLTEQQKDAVRTILSSAELLLSLVEQVLQLSRIESGSLELDISDLDVDPLLRQCLEMIVPMANQRGIVVSHQIGRLPRVRADALRLKQVIVNLLGNAVKYNVPNGRVWLNCKLEPDALLITVGDSGRGIDPELQDRVFEPFDRLGVEGSSVEGTGIGLAISRQLIDLMSGSIGFTSEPGKGSEFWIRIPVSPNQKPVGDVAERLREHVTRSAS